LCCCKPKRSDEAAQLLTQYFRAGQKQTFQPCVFDTFSITATLQNLRGEITAAIATKFFT
jgi:hypothetical protein